MSQNNRSTSRKQSMKMAFCGLVAALSVVLMLTGGLIPIMTYCAPMAGAVLLLPVMLEYDKKSAWTVFAAVSLITLFLGIDKEAAFFYIFIGYYPILKWSIDRIHNKPLRLIIKLAVFNGSILLMYALLGFVFHMDAVVAEFAEMGKVLMVVFVLMLNLCLFLYDRLITPLALLYFNRIRPKMKFMNT